MYSMPEKYPIIFVVKKMFEYMPDTFIQHYTEGFSQCSKARKERTNEWTKERKKE